MRPAAALTCLLLVACGAPSPAQPARAGSSGDECPGRTELMAAEEALAACRGTHATDPGWPAHGAYDALVPRLAAHLASLDPPREVTSEETQALAEEIWELLDQADFPPGTDSVRGRAEDAAERLLRDRGAREAPGAAIEALDAVTQVGTAADPTGGADPCATEALRAAQAHAADGC